MFARTYTYQVGRGLKPRVQACLVGTAYVAPDYQVGRGRRGMGWASLGRLQG